MNMPLPIRSFAALFAGLPFWPLPRVGRFGRRTTLIDPNSQRVEVCPPSLRQKPAAAAGGSGPWQHLLFWLLAPAPHATSPTPGQLVAVRTEFAATLADIDTGDADRLRERIEQARSLRELWHLRAEIYRVVGVTHSQSQAEQRLELLNRHFPTRSPRSQFTVQATQP